MDLDQRRFALLGVGGAMLRPSAFSQQRRGNALLVWSCLGVGLAGCFVLAGTAILAATVLLLRPDGVVGGHAWSEYPAGCLVDANGDDVLDLVGLTGALGDQHTPTILDGKTGKVIWRGGGTIQDSKLFCAGSWFGIARPDFSVAFYDATAPERHHQITLSDRVQAVGEKGGCVRLKLIDGKEAQHVLPNAKQKSCVGITVQDVGSPRNLMTMKRLKNPHPRLRLGYQAIAVDGTRTATLLARERGTPMLHLELEGFGVQGVDLGYCMGHRTFVIIANDRVVVWGLRPADSDHGYLVGVDGNTGAELYAKFQAGNRSNWLGLLEYNGRYVLAVWGSAVHAYDPATGERVWRYGH